MANLEETAVWTPGVYQLETTDPVLGGPVQPEPATGGIANRQALALANRTVYLKAQVELKANSDALLASFNGPLPFARLSGVPTSFTASPHQHAWADVTSKPAQATRWPKWGEVTDKPASFAASPHQHAWTDVTGKPAQATRWPKWSEVTDKPASFGPQIVTLATLPTTDIGPVIVADVAEVWVWVITPYYTGYRSPLCGRPVDGHTGAPLASEIDAVGGLLSKSAYAGLWGYAQENDLVVSQSDWTANIGAHWFVDVSDSQFRVPDLRNMFRRYSGTDADTANARALGSRQNGAIAAHTHFDQSAYADNPSLLPPGQPASSTRYAKQLPQRQSKPCRYLRYRTSIWLAVSANWWLRNPAGQRCLPPPRPCLG